MLKLEKAIQQLIANGYDDNLATQLPKLFIADFFEKEKERLSEALDIFIDQVQREKILPDEGHNVNFGEVIQVEDDNSFYGIFKEFSLKIHEGFFGIVRRQPLQNILISGHAMEYINNDTNNESVSFVKEIVGSKDNYQDLYLIRPDIECQIESNINAHAQHLYSLLLNCNLSDEMMSKIMDEYYYICPKNSIFIRANDLYSLLLSKGLNNSSISIIFGDYASCIPRFTTFGPQNGIYVNYDDIMKIGNYQSDKIKR